MPNWGTRPHNAVLALDEEFLRTVDPGGTPSDETITAQEILDGLIFTDIFAVLADEVDAILTHNLGDANAVLLTVVPDWNLGSWWVTAQDANTITITFENPPSGAQSIVFAVRPS